MKSAEKEKQLLDYVSVYDQKIQETAYYLRSFVAKNYPEANQPIYDSYNAVSIVFSLSDKMDDAFCHIALYKNHVNFGFNRGTAINNPELKLEGNGKLIRHYKVKDLDNIPVDQLSELLHKAVKISNASNPALARQSLKSQLIIKLTSGKKVRP